MTRSPDQTSEPRRDYAADVERLRVTYAAALDVERDAQDAHDSRRTVETRERLDACRADVAAVLDALTFALDQRGAPTFDPSQDILSTRPAVDALKRLDIGSTVPDPLDGSRHTVVTGRNKKGQTRKVVAHGRATVQGATEWNVDALAAHIGADTAAVVDVLAASRLDQVDRLTLGASTLDVERAADQILAALDVDAMVGTDVRSWEHVDSLDQVEHDRDADAMTVAILAGETLDTLTALSRHRCGITGYLAADALDLSTVTAATVPPRRRVAAAQSAWRDHALDPSQLSPRGRLDLGDLVDVTAPTVETAGWPTMGPRSSRPRVPTPRKTEADQVEHVETGVPAGNGRAAAYWRDVDPTDVERLVGRSPRRPAVPRCKPRRARVDVERGAVSLDGYVLDVRDRRVKLDRDGTRATVAPHWRDAHAADATCPRCEHYAATLAASERWHVGNVTLDRGERSTGSGSARPSTVAAREQVAALAAARRDQVDAQTLDAPTFDQVAASLDLLDVDALDIPVVAFRSAVGTVRVSRMANGRLDVRADGLRIGRPRSTRAALDLVADALALDVDQ